MVSLWLAKIHPSPHKIDHELDLGDVEQFRQKRKNISFIPLFVVNVPQIKGTRHEDMIEARSAEKEIRITRKILRRIPKLCLLDKLRNYVNAQVINLKAGSRRRNEGAHVPKPATKIKN